MGNGAALEMIIGGLEIMLDGIQRLRRANDWVNQNDSPIGRRAHLDAVRRGLVAGYKVGRRVLVRRGDLEEYAERYRVRLVGEPPP